jgi:hypothetical protein
MGTPPPDFLTTPYKEFGQNPKDPPLDFQLLCIYASNLLHLTYLPACQVRIQNVRAL